MSTLTKVLIVLLSLFSIFLSGIVTTYVGSANNYRTAYEEQAKELRAIKEQNRAMIGQYASKEEKLAQIQSNLTKKILTLEQEKTQSEVDLRNCQRENLTYQERVSNWASVVEGLNQTISGVEKSLSLAQSKLDKMRQSQITDRRDLNQMTTALNEKMAQVESLEKERRRLLEQKVELEKQSNGSDFLSNSATVTPQNGKARQAMPVISEGLVLSGQINSVDMQNSLVSLSLGSSDGIQKGMKFYATRKDNFICEVVITDVDIDSCAGVIQLMNEKPIPGDGVSTKL